MSTAQFTIPLITVIPGQVIAASLWNNEYTNLFTNLNPLGVGAYSDTDPQMQTQTDPFPSGSTSRPTSMGGEIERLRFVLAGITGNSFWYQVPLTTLSAVSTSLTAILARFPVQTADIGDAQVTLAKLASLSVDENKLTTSVAGTTLTGGAGSPLNVANGGVGTAQLASSLAISTLNVLTALNFQGFNTLKILQVSYFHTETSGNTASTSFTNTNLTGSFTPKISTSKILLFAFGVVSQNVGDGGYFTLARAGTNLAPSSAGLMGTVSGNNYNLALMFVDAPSTVSAITYSVQYRTAGGGATIVFPVTLGGIVPSAGLLIIEIAI